MKAKQKLTAVVLIDAQALIHRAFHALPLLTDRRGQPTNAVYGFFSVFLKMVKDVAPDYIAACFDRPEPTFRDELFKDYKGHRPKTPDALIQQVPIVKEILSAFRVPVVELAGYEADDLIGTLATRLAKAHPAWRVIIATGDLDTLQLVSPNINVYTLKKGVSDTTVYDEKAVRARYGLTPSQVADYKGLVGDVSDNIPGVKGIGEKTASELLQKFKSIEGIYAVLEKNETKVTPPRAREVLKVSHDEALFSKMLATIRCDAPVEFAVEQAKWGAFDKSAAVAGLLKYGFRSLVERLPFDTAAFVKPREAPQFMATRVREWPTATAGQTFGFQENALAMKRDGAYAVGPFAVPAIGSDASVFDYKPLYKALKAAGQNEPAPAAFDAMLAAWLARPGRSSYAPEDFYKEYFGGQPVIRGDGLSDAEQAAVRRAALAAAMRDKLAPLLKKQKLDKMLQEVELPLTPILANMELAGIKLDSSVLQKLQRELATEITELQKSIHKAAGSDFNISSPKQLSEILFEKLKLPTESIRRTPTGAISTDEQELTKLMNSHPIVADILAFRERAKLMNTYLEPLPQYADKQGRIHTTFIQTGTVTGRLSSADPNLQNIPLRSDWGKRIRSAFVAELGWSFISADFSQIDLRVAAHIAKDKRMIEAFLNNEDIHTTTAAAVLGIKAKDVTSSQRRQAKAVNFGIIYGLSAFGLSESTGMAREEAREFIQAYLDRFSGIKAYMAATKALAYKQGFVETLLGRRRYLPELKVGSFRVKAAAEREAINHPVQGTSADIMKLAMISVARLLNEKRKAQSAKELIGGLFSKPEKKSGRAPRMLLQVHDELIFEVPDEQVAPFAPKIQKAMESAYKLVVPLKVEVSVGKNWGQLKA